MYYLENVSQNAPKDIFEVTCKVTGVILTVSMHRVIQCVT